MMVLECVPRKIRQEEADLFICNSFNDVVNKNEEGRRRNCLLKYITEGNAEGTNGRGRRLKQLLGKEMILNFQKRSTVSPYLNSLRKRLWTCRRTG
jgi:hypothetical protein